MTRRTGPQRAPALAAALIAAACALPAAASADAPGLFSPIEGGPAVPFRLHPVWDTGVLALDAGVLLSMKHLVDHPHTDGDRAALNGLDAPVVSWGQDDAAMFSSDLAVSLGLAFAVADSAVVGKHDGARSGAVTFGLYAESVLTSVAVVEIVKQTVQRPRPCSYQPVRRTREALHCGPEDDDAYLSFPSGHTATAASVSATAIYLAFAEEGSGVRASLALAGGLALTGFTAAERMRAGKHFPTDVMTGAAIGATVGVVVPMLHRRRGEADADAPATGAAALGSDGRLLSVAGVF